ncbi:hypothetical protein PT974_08461 [Cladobotryum mycophilum]|uniref:DUF7729 domain-containing protein n=1 Tax=Cladobotryum mycophilum TaxID=491253 RepID=A0ABR0SEH5_9HYPO
MDTFPSPIGVGAAVPQWPKTSNAKRTRSRIPIAVLGVALLATLSSAAVAQDIAKSARLVVQTTSFSPPSSTLLPHHPLTILPDAVKPAATNGEQELLLHQRSPDSGGGSPGDDAPPKGGDKKSSAKPTSTTSTTSSTTSAAQSETTLSPLPSPFDNTPASAFKSPGSDDSCPNFMSSLLSNPTFKSCYPLSMMLQTSTSFFQAEKSLLSITRVLDATCKVDSLSCATFLDTAAANLTDRACKQEIDRNQTLVLQAYRGLKAYRTLYSATCLQDPKTDQYCFADAVTNLDAPSDNYLYFLPYGLSLPGGSSPTCFTCTQQTMAIYHAAAADRRQYIANTYEDAARQINTLCGQNYVNTTLPPAASLAAISSPTYHILFTILCVAFALLL